MAQALDLSRPPPPPIHPAFSERVLVFPHCPKTAGLTLASGLKVMFGPHYVRLKNPRALRKIAPEARSGIAAVSGHFSLPKAEVAIVPLLNRKPLYVATVRDPVERA